MAAVSRLIWWSCFASTNNTTKSNFNTKSIQIKIPTVEQTKKFLFSYECIEVRKITIIPFFALVGWIFSVIKIKNYNDNDRKNNNNNKIKFADSIALQVIFSTIGAAFGYVTACNVISAPIILSVIGINSYITK